MSDVSHYVRQLDVSSGVVSGLAAVLFDIVLLGIIKAEAQFICAAANLYLIYDRRKAISPTTSRLGFVTGSPVGHITLARCFSLLIAAATAAVLILGFSINGRTVTRFNTVTHGSVVVASKVPPTIDYENEYMRIPVRSGPAEKAFSRRVMAFFNMFTCLRNNFTHSTQYAYAYRDLSVDRTMVNHSTALDGGECVTTDVFEEELTVRTVPMLFPNNPIECQFRGLTLSMKDGEVTGHATFSHSSLCNMNISRLMCFRDELTSCAGAGTLKDTEGEKAYIVVVYNIDEPNVSGSAEIQQLESRDHYDRLAANVAFFTRTFVAPKPSYLSQMGFLTVKYNVPLTRIVNKREISDINIRYAAPTLGFIFAIATLLAVVTMISWACVVHKKGRDQYKTFCTVPEILTLADYGGTSKERCNSGDSRYISLQNYVPVLVVKKAEGCSEGSWDEDDIQ